MEFRPSYEMEGDGCMKQKYEAPQIELLKWETSDIVTNSIVPGENETPPTPWDVEI